MSVKSRSKAIALSNKKVASFEDFGPSRIAAALAVALGSSPVWAATGPGTNNINLSSTFATGTSMNTVGAVTDIHTTTVKGNTGFNSFGDFNVNAGNTVNLHVPDGKANLVNLVHDSKAVINGNLNGLKDGKIGGNIIFADPHGVVVGAAGVVNVGSLTLTTPSHTQMHQIGAAISGSGAEADAVAADLMAGKFNAGTGEIKIEGQVNSAGSVNLFAASSIVANGAKLNAGAKVFNATVNTDGVVDATAAVSQDGHIVIVGRHDVTLSGELKALMANGGGGDVVVNAPVLKVTETGKINTRAVDGSTEVSGNIDLQAFTDKSLVVVRADGSKIDDVAELKGAITQQSVAASESSNTHVAKIEIARGAVLDAGHVDGSKAGDITLEARAVEKQIGGYAQAHASIDIAGNLTGKNITAHSDAQAMIESGLFSALFSNIEIQAMIDKVKTSKGFTLEEAHQYVYAELVDALDSVKESKDTTPPSSYSELISILPYATFAVAEASSRVTVAGSANLNAYADLMLTAEAIRYVDTANFSLPVITSKLPFNVGIAYGRLSGSTKVEVLDNATLASNDLDLRAQSRDTLKLEGNAKTTRDGSGSIINTGTGEVTPPSNTSTWSAAFSMAHTDITTTASVARNAKLGAVKGDVSVTALTEQSLSNKATSTSVGHGAFGGPAVALTLFNSNTTARFDADLDANSLSVNAANIVSEQSNIASVQAGKALLDSLQAKALSGAAFKDFTTQLGIVIKSFFSKDVKFEAIDKKDSELRVGSAVAVGIANHQALATIGGGTAGKKQSLTLDGDLLVTALQHQRSLHNTAESLVLADAEKDDGNKYSLSVAVSFNQLTQQTRALIGNNTDVVANHIGVAARNEQLLDFAGLDRWNSLEAVFNNLKTHIGNPLNIVKAIGTSYANSSSQGEVAGLAGAVSVLNTNIESEAWAGDNVTLTANATGNTWKNKPYSFLAPIVDEDNKEDKARKVLRDFEWSWDSALDISATNHIQQFGIAGNLAMLLFGSSSDGTAVGGNVNLQMTDNKASAGIGANSVVKAARVDVKALQEELIIGASPSAGKGTSTAGNGSIVISALNSKVNASIHNSTRVEAKQVQVQAEHQLGLWTAAGAVAVSDETGIGAGIAVNVVNTDVYALVGDNRSLRASALGAGVASTSKATWVADEVLVNADSNGQVGTFSIAGAVGRTEDEQAAQEKANKESADKGLVDSVAGIGQGLLQSIVSAITGDGGGKAGLSSSLDSAKGAANSIKDTVVSVPDKIKKVLEDLLSDEIPGSNETGSTKQSMALAGSGSVNVVGQKTRAHLGDIVLDPRDPTALGSKVTVLSLNQTNQLSGSGAGALTLSGSKKAESSVAIAGAMAYNHLFNVTEAALKNTTLNNNDQLQVQAASAGDQVAMGLGLAVATSGQSNTAVSMSVSGGVITNTTSALVLDSVVNQRAASTRGIAVNAYDRSRTLLGGGSFSLATGGQGSATSAGGSLVLGVQKNKLTADWLGSTATGFKSFDVTANSAARVLAGAIGVAISTGKNDSASGSGAVAVVVVDNDVRAKVDKSTKGNSSLTGTAVNVKAQSVSGLSALDGVFKQAGLTALSHTNLDLDGAQTAAKIDGTMDTQDDLLVEDDADKKGTNTDHSLFSGSLAGEAVLAIAGNVAATSGKTSVGGAVSIVYTGSDYTASLANTLVDLTGNMNVNAANSTTVLAAAIGAAASKENAVSGSTTAVVGRGRINANVDMTGRVLKANDLVVNATKGGGSYSLAGNITVGMNNAAVGGAISLNDMEQTAAAIVQNGTYTLTRDAKIGAAMQSQIMTAALSGQGSADGSAIGGAITFNRIDDTTNALLNNATMTARNLSITASQPDLGASIKSIAFNVSAAGGQAGVGGAVAVNLLLAERSAKLLGSTVNLSGSANLSSSLDGEIWGIGVDAAGGSDAGVGGSIVVNVIDGADQVLIDNSTLLTTGSASPLNLDAASGNGLLIASLAGSVKGSGKAAVGGAISVNRIGANRTALIRNSRNVSGFSNATLNSGTQQDIYAIAIAGGGAGEVAVNGSSTSNVLQGTERAAIENSTLGVTKLSLSAALGDRTIWSLAGAFGGAGKVAVGVANTNNIILSKRLAEVINSDLTVGGALTLASGGSSNIRSIAVGAGGAGTAAVGGSIAINVVEGEERAEIKKGTVQAGSVTVDVTRGDTDIKTLAGNAQGAGTAAVGASIAVSTINQQRTARIIDSSLTLGAGNALVQASTGGHILTLAAAGGGAGTAAVMFSNTSNNIAAKTRAEVINSQGSAGKLEILASDTSSIHAGSGAVAGAGSAAVGVGTAINRVDSEIYASLTGNLSTGWALTNLRIDANSQSNIIAGIVAGGGAGTAAVSTVAATNIIQTLTQAQIGGGAQVVAQNNIAVSARNLDTILGSAVSAAGSGNASIAALATVNVVETNTKAFISGSTTSVSALAKNSSDTMLVDSGALNNAPSDNHEWISGEQFNPYPNLSIKQHRITGLAVQASSLQQVGQIALSASLAVVPLASAAVSGVVNTTVLGGSTLGYIDAARINQQTGASSAQNVRVGANSHSYTAGYLAAVAGGPSAATVGAGVDNTIISRLTQARLSGVQLNSLGKTEVLAGSGQYVATVIASIAGGIVAPGVSSSLVILKGETEALLNNGSQLDVGSLKVNATALQRLAPNAASLTGGAVAVSGAVVTLFNQSITRAWLGTELNAATQASTARTQVLSGGTEVSALNTTGVLMNVAAAGGGGAAVGGSIGVAVLETTTQAGASQVNFGNASRRLGHLSITAKDVTNVQNSVGAALIGGSSMGASANVLVANSATRALLDRSSLVGGQLTVNALREADIRLKTITGAVGASSGLSGSMGLLLLGSGSTTVTTSKNDEGGEANLNAMDELDKGGNGSLSQANNIGNADKAGTLSYEAYEWDSATQQYKLVTKTDSATTNRVNANRVDLDDRFEAGSLRKHETLARVSNSSLDVTAATNISALDKLYASNLTGSGAVGASAVGAGLALTLSNARVVSELVGGSSQSGSLKLDAQTQTLGSHAKAVKVEAYTGAAGFGVGLGAAWAVGQMRNEIKSYISGEHSSTGEIALSAQESLGLDIDAVGASAGAAAAGIVVASGVRDSGVTVQVANGAKLTGKGIKLNARGEGGIDVDGTAAAGGLTVAGTGVAAVAIDRTRVQALGGNNIMLDGGTTGVALTASALPQLNASALGVTVSGGVAVGASYSRSQTDNTVTAKLGNDADVRGTGGLQLKAALEYNRTGSEINPDRANVRAKAVAGSGGLFLSANATIAEAYNTANVSALTGSNLQLPSGRVEIVADSRSHQYADALGVAVGGLAVGASVAKAESESTTNATLGSFANDRNSTSKITDLVISANAEDINQAKTVAGSGGLVAGNASLARTRTVGSATAKIGESVSLKVGSLSLTGEYRAIFGSHANSVNAALAGASGAGSKNHVEANSLASIGNNSQIAAGGDLVVTANNNIYSSHLGQVASGAGGGVISGQAVYSDTHIGSTAQVKVGNKVTLLAGIGAADYSARLLLQAFTRMAVSESVTLSTGGAIAGGGVSVDSVANLNNKVNIGSDGELFSSGSLGAGTFTQASMNLEALASTWGAAGLADARADADLNSDQQLTLGSNTKLEALGNITLSAGDDAQGLWQTSLQANSVAHSSVRGIIAIPTVKADAHILNRANTVLNAGSQVLSARNIRAGSYYGLANAQADGEARGYQLGFIPVTSRNSNSNVTRDIKATLNGTLLAGRYHELLINIAANGTITQTAGLPIDVRQVINFNPRQFLNSLTDLDPVTRAVIEGTISGSNVGAIALGDMLAAGGTVTINADTLAGQGTITANGGPRIQITNQSANYLLVNSAVIPDQPGGYVYFTGAATRSKYAGQVNEVNASRRPEIRIDSSYSGNVGGVNYGPAIFLMGDLLNQGGLIHISNAKGSLGQFGVTYGQQVLVEVPNGSMTVFTPNKYWSVNGNPFSEWKSFAGVTGSENEAVELVANYIYQTPNAGSLAGTLLLNNALLYQGGYYSDDDGSSVVVFGSCLPALPNPNSNCSESIGKSFTGQAAEFQGMNNTPSWMPYLRYKSLTKSALTYEKAQLGAGSETGNGKRIVGGQVGIQAKYIDINGTISSGMTTNRSVVINAGLDAWVSAHSCTSGLCIEAVDIPTHLLTASSGQVIGAKYDFVNKRILLDDVNASGGGYIYMRGGIISTNPSGRIEVNNGFGEVKIDNRSSHQLQLGDIDTGVGSVGIVQIVDTLKPMVAGQYLSTWYVHDQNSGLSIYNNSNGGNSLLNAYLVSTSSSSTATYNPLANARFEWYQQATLSRKVSGDGATFSVSNWVWNDRTPNDPWYVSEGAVRAVSSNNVYEQSISGSFDRYEMQGVAYHGCGNSIGSGCNWDFEASGQHSDGSYYAGWTYRFPLAATLRINHSVKADNPFQIAFVGNSTASIDAKTNNNLIIGGRLNNVGGLTQLNAVGDIINTNEGISFSKDLLMTAGGSIGQDGRSVVAGLVEGGTLQVRSGAAGMNLDLTTSAWVRSINAGNGLGDVTLKVNGNLNGLGGLAAGTPDVLGRNISLSATGAIGSASRALQIIAKEQNTAGGGSTYGNLNAFALGNIFINEIEGDVWVDRVVSETGNVWLKAEKGSLFDAGQRLASDTLDEAQRLQIWEKLKLTSAYGAEANIQQGTVKPFEDQVASQYREYWRLLGLGSVQGGDFVLNQDNLDLYRPLAELQLGQSGLSDADVQRFAAERYNGYVLFFDEVFGSGWSQLADFQAVRDNFTYTATSAQIAALTHDAIWTEGELRYAIDATALGSASSTPVGAAEPNVSGRQVTLLAANSIGRMADSLSIDFAALQAGTLTAQQAAALAIANAPGDVTLQYDANGQLVSLLVNRTQPFYVAASERFDANTGAGLYLQSAGDLNIGSVVVGGDARLAAASSILAVNGAGSLSVGGNLTLLAGTGNLGTVDDDGLLSLNVGGSLLSASAGQHIGLRWMNGDFRFSRVFAVGDLRLDAPNGSLVGQLEGVSLIAQNIHLNARDSILGVNGGALEIDQSSVTGELNVQAGADVRLLDSNALRVGVIDVGGDLSLGATSTLVGRDLHAGGNLSLSAPAGIDVQRLSVGGNLLVNTLADIRLRERALVGGNASWIGANLAMDANSLLQFSGLLAVNTTGNMTLGQLYHDGQTVGSLFNLQAGGHIQGNGDGQVNLRSATKGTATLLAGTGIGLANRPLVVDMPELTRVQSRQGDIYLTYNSALQGATIQADAGNIVLSGPQHSLQLQQLLASGNIRYSGAGLQVGSLNAGASLTAHSSADLTLTTAQVGTDAELTAGGLFSSNLLTVGGDWLLTAGRAQVGTANITGDSDLTVTGHLQLGQLNGLGAELKLGSANITGLSLSGALDLRVNSALSLLKAQVGAAAQLHHTGLTPASLHYASLVVGDTLTVTGVGHWTGDNAQAAQQILFDVGSADLGTLHSALGHVRINAADSFAADELHSAKQSVQITAGGAQLGNVSAATTLTVHTTADALRITTASSGGNMQLTTKAGSLADIHFGPLANPNTPNVLVPSHLNAGGNLLIRADGDVFGGNAQAQGLLEIFGRNMHLGRAQSLHNDVYLQATGNAQQGHGDISGLKVDADGSVSIIADGTLRIDNVEFGNSYTLRAGNDLNVGIGGDLNITGIAEAGRDLTFNVGGLVDLQGIKAGRNVVVNAGAGIHFSEGVEAGGAVNLHARGGDITLGTGIESSGLYLGDAINGDVQLNASGAIVVPSIVANNGNLSVNGNSLSLDQLDVSGNVGLQSAGLLRVGSSRSGGDQHWQSGQDINLTQVQAGGQVLLEAQRHLSGRGLVTAASDLRINTLGNVDLQALSAGRNTQLTTGGSVNLSEGIQSGSHVSIHAQGGDITLGTGIESSGLYLGDAIHGDVQLSASGAIVVPSIVANNGNLSVNGHSLSLDQLDVSGNVGLQSAGLLRVGSSRSGGDQHWQSGQDINLTQVQAGGQVLLEAQRHLSGRGLVAAASDLRINTLGNVDLQALSAGRNTQLTTGGSVNLSEGIQSGSHVSIHAQGGDITLGTGIESSGQYLGGAINGDVQLNASGAIVVPSIVANNGNLSVNGNSLSLDQLDVSGNVGLQSVGLLRVGSSRSGGDQHWQSGQDINLTQVQAGGQVLLEAQRHLSGRGLVTAASDLRINTLGNVDLQALSAGRNTQLTTGGSVNLSEGIQSGSHVSIHAQGGDITLGTGIESSGLFGGSTVGGNVLLNAAGDIVMRNIQASNGLIAASGHNLNLGELLSSEHIELLARGAIQVGSSQSAGNQTWQADEDIVFNRLLATGQVMLDSLRDTRGTTLLADQSVTIHAGWRNGVASDADIIVDEIRAPSISLWSGRLIRVANASVGQSIDVHAKDVELYGQHTGSGQLNLSITGIGNSQAERLVFGIQAQHIVIPQLYAADIQLQFSSDQLDILDAQGVERLRLQTPQALIMMNNLSPVYISGADVQLYEPDGAFRFSQNQLSSTTNAYVLHRAPTHQVLLPNFMEDHEASSTLLYQGMTAARYSEQFVSQNYLLSRLASLLNASMLRLPARHWMASWNTQPINTRINLNLPEQPATSEEVSKWEI